MAKDIQDEINEYLIKASKPTILKKCLWIKWLKNLGRLLLLKNFPFFLKLEKALYTEGLIQGKSYLSEAEKEDLY